jgi:hypothetical protein
VEALPSEAAQLMLGPDLDVEQNDSPGG